MSLWAKRIELREGRDERSAHPCLRESIPMVGVARQNGAGAVELFEGDDEGEFVLESQRAEGPAEVGSLEQTLVVSVSAADDDGHGTGGLLPLVELGGELAAGEWCSVFVEDHAEAAFTAGEEVGAFAWFVGCFDRDVFDGYELGQACEIFIASRFGVGEGGLADGEQQPFHGC